MTDEVPLDPNPRWLAPNWYGTIPALHYFNNRHRDNQSMLSNPREIQPASYFFRPPTHPKCHNNPFGYREAGAVAVGVRPNLLELFEALTDVEMSKGRVGWVELDIAFGKLDWEGHGEIVAGYEFGSPQDRLLVMTTVLCQDMIVELDTERTGPPPLIASISSLPPCQADSKKRFQVKLKQIEGLDVWRVLREISLQRPSPNAICPPNPVQHPRILHRLLYHLLFPYDLILRERTLVTFDLSDMGGERSQYPGVRTNHWHTFRWMEWLIWLSGSEHPCLGFGVGSSPEKLGVSILRELDIEFEHICLSGTRVTDLPVELFALVDVLDCICIPENPTFDRTMLADQLPLPATVLNPARGMITHIHKPRIGFRVTPAVRIYRQIDVSFPDGWPNRVETEITFPEYDRTQTIAMGALPLADILIKKIRQELVTAPSSYNQSIPVVDLVRSLGMADHAVNKGYASVKRMAKDIWIFGSASEEDPPRNHFSRTSGVPETLLAAVRNSYLCGWCHASIRCEEPARSQRDMLLWLEDLPAMMQGGRHPGSSDSGDREAAVICDRLCPRCMDHGQAAKNISLSNAPERCSHHGLTIDDPSHAALHRAD